MKKTEICFGVGGGLAGLIVALLSLFLLLPYSTETIIIPPETIKIDAVVCLAANVVGITGALLVQKNNLLGSAVMSVALVVVLFFGFPWQSISAVLYIISVVMALAPDKLNT
ncbi:MAG: hypothetical protein PHO15_10080 [Eubacteriales bacterium]|nr:hypothetical protein [Eubacteriales bacterium]